MSVQVLHGFFAVGPNQPDAVAIAGFCAAAELVGEFEQDGGGRAAVVGADETGVAQRVIGVVVAEDGDDAIFFAGKLRDDVADGELPFHRVGGKGVVFDLIAFQVIENVVLQLLVILVAHVALAEGGDFAGVLEGALGVDVREGRCRKLRWTTAGASDFAIAASAAGAGLEFVVPCCTPLCLTMQSAAGLEKVLPTEDTEEHGGNLASAVLGRASLVFRVVLCSQELLRVLLGALLALRGMHEPGDRDAQDIQRHHGRGENAHVQMSGVGVMMAATMKMPRIE